MSAHHDADAFCRVVRCTVGRRQLDALARATGGGRRARRAAMEQAVMASAWASAMPGQRATDWVRVVQPIEPPLEGIRTDEPLLVLVAGLRRVVALEAGAGDEAARRRLAAAREGFGEPMRAHILGVLAHAAMRADDPLG